MTESEEVVAAGPDGLFSFKRVRDHVSKPWSKPRPFPGAPLGSSSVSGIALREDEFEAEKRLDVFCVANGSLYCFSRSTPRKDQKASPSFVADPSPPLLATYRVSGTPCIATTQNSTYTSSGRRYSLVVPSQSGGLLHTSAYCSNCTKAEWDPVDHVATHLGMVSAVTIATIDYGSNDSRNDIVAVCIAQGRLNSVEGPFSRPDRVYSSSLCWKGEITDKIHHPGEVTGNPALLQRKPQERQLDLLVPSAEGGIFHFVRTSSMPDEWHMIGRIGFPSGLPAAGSLAFILHKRSPIYSREEFGAAIQIGGRLYTTKTLEQRHPWSGCRLYPIEGPGPSSD